MDSQIKKTAFFVGDISENDIKNIDCFLGNDVALFIPAVGHCSYATTKAHTHPAYSFVLTFDANLLFGSQKSSSERVTKGTIIAMSPSFQHHEEESQDFSCYYAIFIDTTYFNEVLSWYNISPNPSYPFTVASPSKELLPYLREFMIATAQSGFASIHKKDALEQLITHSIVESFHAITHKDSRHTIHDRVEIDRAVEFMQSHLGDKLSLDIIAKEVYLSPSHLSSLFKEAVGKTVMGYLTEVRLQSARKLLLLKEYSISEIAFLCGFSSPSHLSQSFKRGYGLSPREVLKST